MKALTLVCLLLTSLATSSYHNLAFLQLREDKYPIHKVLELIPESDMREFCNSIGKQFNVQNLVSFCDKSSKETLIHSVIDLIDKNNAVDKVFDFIASVPDRLYNIEVLKGIFAIDVPKSKKLIYAADAFARKLFDQEDEEPSLKDEIENLTNIDEIKEKLEEAGANYAVIVIMKNAQNVREENLDYLINLKNYASQLVDTVFYHNGTILKQTELEEHLSGLSSGDLDAYYQKAQKLSKNIMGNDDKADKSSQKDYILSQATVLPIIAAPEFIKRVDL